MSLKNKLSSFAVYCRTQYSKFIAWAKPQFYGDTGTGKTGQTKHAASLRGENPNPDLHNLAVVGNIGTLGTNLLGVYSVYLWFCWYLGWNVNIIISIVVFIASIYIAWALMASQIYSIRALIELILENLTIKNWERQGVEKKEGERRPAALPLYPSESDWNGRDRLLTHLDVMGKKRWDIPTSKSAHVAFKQDIVANRNAAWLNAIFSYIGNVAVTVLALFAIAFLSMNAKEERINDQIRQLVAQQNITLNEEDDKRLQGLTADEIAIDLGLTSSQIGQDLKALYEAKEALIEEAYASGVKIGIYLLLIQGLLLSGIVIGGVLWEELRQRRILLPTLIEELNKEAIGGTPSASTPAAAAPPTGATIPE